jgi:hypothetical protein
MRASNSGVKDKVVVYLTSDSYENAGACGKNDMFVMFAYVSLSPAGNETLPDW